MTNNDAYFGSAGDALEVGEPDTDGEVEFSIYSEHYGIYAGAHLGVAERQRLIRQLRACTPEEGE